MNRVARKSDSHPNIDLTRLTRSGRAPGPIVRDLSKGRDESDVGVPSWRAFGSGRAWLVGTILKVLTFFVVVAALIFGPPVLECRQRAQTGFFAGETLWGCVGAATNQRLRSFENRINTLLRGSGT